MINLLNTRTESTLSYSRWHNLHDEPHDKHDRRKNNIRIRQQIYYGKFSERNVEQVQTDKIEYERKENPTKKVQKKMRRKRKQKLDKFVP